MTMAGCMLVSFFQLDDKLSWCQAKSNETVDSLFKRGRIVEDLKNKSETVLQNLLREFGYTQAHLRGQWERQRELQLKVLENESENDLLKQIEDLVELEDKLNDTK